MNDKERVAIYGIGTETERLLPDLCRKYNVIGFLDGFRNDGEIYGKRILAIDEVMDRGINQIIVVARPGSCRVIAKRIGNICRDNGIELFDIRGNNLLKETRIVYDFTSVKGYTKAQLLKAASKVDVVSFDLFDTLIARNIASSEDVIELVEARLLERNIQIFNFKTVRLAAEKDLSRYAAPRLEDIYSLVLEKIGYTDVSATELAELEYEIDRALVCPRLEMLDVIRRIKSMGKIVYITSDNYYSLVQIRQILTDNKIEDIDEILVSCEFNRGKLSGLFDEVKAKAGDMRILHVGDDLTADIEAARRNGLDTFHIYSCSELLDLLGGLKLGNHVSSLSDKIKLGMFITKLFNSPFQFEDDEKKIHVNDSLDLGYLFCAPMIFDFAVWLGEQVKNKGIDTILFCARDGYLLSRFYPKLYPELNTNYFLISRISAIRAGIQDDADIAYVDSMKFSGSVEDNLKVRCGIDVAELSSEDIDEAEEGLKRYSKAILKAAKKKRGNNLKYIQNLNLNAGSIAMFDFVAKGTSQMFLQKLFDEQIQGLYFLQLEPEFMKDKGLSIISFYAEEERERSAIFENYYILETLLTSPDPSVDEFDEEGNAVYTTETRCDKDIDCFMKAQDGVIGFVETFLQICPEKEITVNKALDEAMLILIHNVQIRDKDFLDLKVEDPFFNRITDILDLL